MLSLTNLQVHVVPQNWCCGEASSSARGDDDRHGRREEQRVNGPGEGREIESWEPGLSKHRVCT